MADLLSWAGKQLQGAVSQINPFDGGADYNSVVNKKRKRPQQVVQRPQAVAPPAQPKPQNNVVDDVFKAGRDVLKTVTDYHSPQNAAKVGQGIAKVGKDVVNGIVEAPKVIGTGAAHALNAVNGNLDRRNQAYQRSNQQDINTIRTLGQKMRQTANPIERDRIRKSIGTISKLGDQEYQRNQLMNNQTIKAVDPVKNAAAIGQVGFDVATMGVGTGGVQAAKLAAKQGGKALARNLAVQGAKSGAIAAPSGALGAYVTNGQNTTASDVAKGAGAAFVLGGAIPAASYGVVKAAPIVARGAKQAVKTAPKYTQQARTAIEQINPQVKELDSAYANMQRMFDNTSHIPSRQAYNKAMALNRQQRQALTEGGYFGLGKNNGIPKELHSLADEARKYNSAEEFVNDKTKNRLFHGTSRGFKQFGINAETKQARQETASLLEERGILVNSGKIENGALHIPKDAQERIAKIDAEIESIRRRPNLMPESVKEKGVYLTNDENYAQTFAGKDGKIIEADVDLKNPYIIKDKAGMDLIENAAYYPDIIKNLEAQGFDSIKAPDGQVLVFDPQKARVATLSRQQLADLWNQAKAQEMKSQGGYAKLPNKDSILGSKPVEYFFGDKKSIQNAVARNNSAVLEAMPAQAIAPPKKPTSVAVAESAPMQPGTPNNLVKNSDIPPVQKSSRYASKTVPESEFVSQEVGKKAKQNAPLYNVETEKQRYTSALMGLKKNGEENFENSVRERLSSKAGTIESQDVADAQTLAQLLDARGDKVSLQKASEIYDKLSEHLTAAGQTVQAASILSRRSPQGMSYWANKQLKDAGIKSTPELQLQIKTIADKARKATTQAEKDQAAFELAKTVSDNIPSSTKDRVVNAWRAGLLTAPTTTGGNILGNSSEAFTRKFLVNPTAIAADKAMGLFTGKRAMALSPSGTAAEGMKEGSSKLGKYIKTGFDERNVARSVTGELGKYENKADINYGKSKLGNLMGDYVNKTYRLMGTADMPFWYSARRESLGSIANAEAINQGLKGQDKFKFIKEFMDNPPEAAMQRATDEANDATFQNKTALGSAASGLKRPLGAVGDFVIPFTQVPASIATRIITRTPIGTASEMLKQIMKVRNGGSFDQRKMAQAIGEGSVGTGILGSGYALANSGMMTFGLPEDQKERKLWEMEGKQPYSVKVGDRWYSLNYMQPFGTLLAIGGKMAEGAKEGKDITETLAAGIATGGQALMNQSFLKGVSGVLDAIDDPKRYAENWAENTAGSAIPNFVRSLARSSDTNQRNTGNDIGNALKGGIPGLRQTVPEKLDAFGRPLPAKDNFLNQFLNPLKPSIARENDPVVAELRRLLESKNGVLPSSADKASIKGEDGKSALTNSQIQELNKIVGSKQYDHYQSIMNDPRYADLEDEDKARKLKGINKTLFGAEKTKYGYENSLYGDDKVSKLNTKQRQYLKNDSVDFLSSTSSRESYADKYDRLSKDYSSNKDSYTPIERIKKEKELSRLSVQKDFTNDVVSLYNMSKGDVYNYISTNSDGQKMAEDLVKYGDAMVEAGLYKYNKFKNGFGTGSVAKGGRKGGKKSGKKLNSVASLNAILKASRAVKAPKPPKVAKAKTPKMGKTSLAKYKATKKVSQRKAAIPAPKKPKFV